MPLRETWESDGNQGWKDGVPGSQAPRESRKEEGNTGNKKALPGTRMGSAGRTGRRNKRFGDKKWGFRSVSSTGTPETKRGLPGAKGSTGRPNVWCGGVLLSHTLSGAVPSPCQALASGFGMGPGVSPGPWPPQIFSCTVRRWGLPACGGLGTGQRTRICRCFVLWPDNAHCRLVPFAGGRCGPTARGWNVSVAFRPLVPVGSTPRGASTSGLSTTCSAWGLQELEGSTECLSWSRLPA